MSDLVLNTPVYLHITGVMILVIAFFNRDLTRIFHFGLQKKRKNSVKFCISTLVPQLLWITYYDFLFFYSLFYVHSHSLK